MADEPVFMVINVHGCARCGETHQIKFQPFQRQPVTDSDGTEWSYWGMCDNLSEPVLLKVTETETPVSPADLTAQNPYSMVVQIEHKDG